MHFSRPQPPDGLIDRPNISVVLAEELKHVGIATTAALTEIGSLEAWTRLKRAGLHDGIQTLLALEGAVLGIQWQELPRSRRAVLIRQATVS